MISASLMHEKGEGGFRGGRERKHHGKELLFPFLFWLHIYIIFSEHGVWQETPFIIIF